MIIFFEFGRTGNQLFQYIGLKKYFPSEKLVFFGCESLEKYFDEIDVYFINKKKKVMRFLFKLLRTVTFCLADLRILGCIEENDQLDKFNIIIKKGFISNLFVARNIYFQHKDIVNHIEHPPLLKKYLQKEVLRWLDYKKINFKTTPIIFVHIRRNDYQNWPSKENPALLNYDWYKNAIEILKNKFSNPVFIIMGDDIEYIKNCFKETQTLLISNNTPEVDLCIMSMSTSGILSASSFSWWGAYYARINKNKNSIFIGPKFWGGIRMKKWFPPNFKVDWITYIN